MTTSEPLSPRPDPTSEEVARLEQELALSRGRCRRSRGATAGAGGGSPIAGVLVLLAAMLAPLSVLSTWANGQIQDTDRYLATVAPLASDPDVQDAVAARLEEVIFSYLDLEAVTEELVTALEARDLPPSAAATLRALAGPLAAGVRNFVGRPDRGRRTVGRVRDGLDRGEPDRPRGARGRTDRGDRTAPSRSARARSA